MKKHGFIAAFLLFFPLWLHGQTAPEARADFFKLFLASRPTVEEAVFKTRPILGGGLIKVGESARRFTSNETGLVFGRWQSGAWLLQTGTDLKSFRAGSLKGILMGFQDGKYWQINDPILIRYQGETETAAIINTLRSLHQVLSFGIPNLQPGTFKWKGADLEAYDESGALISGNLQTASDGTPERVQFHLPGRDWEYSVDYIYDQARTEDLSPSTFRTSIRKRNGTSFEAVQEMEILSLRTTKSVLPQDLIVPKRFINSERVISVLYGSDNPIFCMRGRRQYEGRNCFNRTTYPFHFNQDREPPEVVARYTLFMYEDIHAIKKAATELGIYGRHIEATFHDNAVQLIAGILDRKQKRLRIFAL